MQRVLREFLHRLTNLSGSNRSLLLLKLQRDQFIDLHQLNYLEDQSSFQIIEKLIQGNEATLTAMLDSRDEQANKQSTLLKRLLRTDELVAQERGANDLHLAWPFVKGRMQDGTLVRAPLCFFPVALIQKNQKWVLQPRTDQRVFLNKSLVLAYAYFNQTALDQPLMDLSMEDYSFDSLIFRSQLYDQLKASGLEINFNQDLFLNSLQNFKEYTRAEFEQDAALGSLKLFPEAVLGIFPQAGSYLVPDYQHMLSEKEDWNLDDFFSQRNPFLLTENGTNEFANLRKAREEYTFAPFPLDAFQEDALRQSKLGHSLVVQGPPGTGKTQLIGNLVADFTSRGQKVLVVCQKRAALDVLHQRLSDIGLAKFIGLVHDFKADRNLIFEQISHQIQHLDEYKTLNNGLDIIQLERKFQQISRRIEQICEELNEYKSALFSAQEAGLSIKELYLSSSPERASVSMKHEYRHFSLNEVDNHKRTLQEYWHYQGLFEWDGFLWKKRLSMAHYGIDDLNTIKQTIDQIKPWFEKIQVLFQEKIKHTITWNQLHHWVAQQDTIHELSVLLNEERVSNHLEFLHQLRDQNAPDQLWLEVIQSRLLSCFDAEGIETSLSSDELGYFQEALESRMQINRDLFKKFYWRFFSKDRVLVNRVLVANKLSSSTEDLVILSKRIDNRLNYEHLISTMRTREWLAPLPTRPNLEALPSWFQFQIKAIKVLKTIQGVQDLDVFFKPEINAQAALKSLLQVIKAMQEEFQKFEKFLLPHQIQESAIGDAPKLKEELSKHFDELCLYDQLIEKLSENELQVYKKIVEALGSSTQVDQAIGLFDNSIRLAWIDHIEAKFPVLRQVSTQKFGLKELELREAISEKEIISRQIVQVQLRERTYHSVEFNRLKNRVTYKDLEHQVNKKKKRWPLRKILNTYSHEVFDLIPCWMASPESVSALFPMEPMFDLVIFDEASQCFAERGLPAMYRAKQLIVAGDSKQLQPHDLYKARWENEDEEEPALEVDSLLELSAQYLNQVYLRAHYRSQHPDLIQFSNRHFYQSKLRTLPSLTQLNNQEAAIEFIKVEGIWHQNKNEAEADTILELVQKLTQQPDHPSIAVVSFNIQQQMLIMDRLDAAPIHYQHSEKLLVRNIENIQGDERDVLIFSIAYAPDAKGNLTMQFGSLNQAGGENRLNVAITRARQKIIIVSSILPNQLKVDDAKNEGPGLLKAYLSYALEVSKGTVQFVNKSNVGSTNSLYAHMQHLQFENQTEAISLQSDLPYADLSVKLNERYAGVFLTDDDLYFQSPSVKDAHAYVPLVLHKKAWPQLQVWSRNYWLNPKQQQADIEKWLFHLPKA